jgi:hypothetical protein
VSSLYLHCIFTVSSVCLHCILTASALFHPATATLKLLITIVSAPAFTQFSFSKIYASAFISPGTAASICPKLGIPLFIWPFIDPMDKASWSVHGPPSTLDYHPKSPKIRGSCRFI